jgi:hypothetical protein
MSGRIIKNIRIFFLFLAAILFFAHMIIPHDHHTADTNPCQDERCPVSNNSNNHHRSFPAHCHAFNDLTSEKTIVHVHTLHIQCMDFVPPSVFDSKVINLQLSRTRIIESHQPVDFFFPELSALRAPPVLG